MNIEEGTLIKLDTGGYSDFDGSAGIIVNISRDFFATADWLFKIFFFDKNEIRWYKRQNFKVIS